MNAETFMKLLGVLVVAGLFMSLPVSATVHGYTLTLPIGGWLALGISPLVLLSLSS